MAERPRHPNKHIEAELKYAESKGWRVELGGAHAWGKILCPYGQRGGCIRRVWSTPTNPEDHARFQRRQIAACPHC